MALSSGIVFIVPIVVTIIGWLYVSRQAEKREYRKELRERISDLRSCATDVEDACANYWLVADRRMSPSAAIRLKAELKRLSNRVTTLQAAGLQFEGVSLITELRQICTGGNFEVRNRRPNRDDDAARVSDAASLLEDLVHSIETSFFASFPPIFERRLKGRLSVLGAIPFLSSDNSQD